MCHMIPGVKLYQSADTIPFLGVSNFVVIGSYISITEGNQRKGYGISLQGLFTVFHSFRWGLQEFIVIGRVHHRQKAAKVLLPRGSR